MTHAKKLLRKFTVALGVLAIAAAVAGTTSLDAQAATKPTKITLKATSKTVDIKGKVTVSVKSVTPSKASKSVPTNQATQKSQRLARKVL